MKEQANPLPHGEKPAAILSASLWAGLMLAGIILWWLALQWRDNAANHDIFWLFTGFQRLGAGHTMAQSFYETNPPLSVYIYAPAFWLAEQSWLSLPRAIILYTTLLLAAAIAATLYAARLIRGVTRGDILLFVTALVVGGTVMAGSNYGQRDHFLALAALPLVLLLLGRTQTPRRLNAADVMILVIGTLFLLLKPYYGLLPAFLMAHRAGTQKRIAALWDIDFIVMALATFGYGLCVYLFFPDYLTVILPAVMDLYIDSGWRYYFSDLSLILSGLLLMLGLSRRPAVPADARALLHILLGCAALSFVIFLLMMKGYAYHLLPCLTFMLVAGLWLAHRLCPWIDNSRLRLWLLAIPLALLCLLIPDSFIPHKRDVEREAITQRIAACAGECPYLIIGSTVRITQLISYYTGKPHASRFPKFWFAEGMVEEGIDFQKDRQRLDRYRHYVDMIVADINADKPKLIFSCKYYADFMPWLTSYENFKAAFAPYHKTSDVWYDHDIFHHGKSAAKPRIVKCTQYERSER
ncbi:MAG TPA: hypothetical protein VGD95_01720 [Micavibrio sp.]